jgi:hypothetical protein
LDAALPLRELQARHLITNDDVDIDTSQRIGTPRYCNSSARVNGSNRLWWSSWVARRRRGTSLRGDFGITDADPARAKRAFDAMMRMKRIDIAALERAADGLRKSA